MDSKLVNRVIERAIAIQSIPAPTFEEGRRAAAVRQMFEEEGLCDIEIDRQDNVYGRLAGSGRSRPLVVSAHIDTVFPSNTDLSVRRTVQRVYGPAIGDNSLGAAGLFGLIWALREEAITLPGDLWLVANVCEEGLGNLRGMQAVVDRFGADVLAYIVLEGMALGQVYHRGLGVRRYKITFNTAGGHSWVDYGQPSAIHTLSTLVTRLTHLPLPTDPRTTLNVGVISGGTTVNSIAAQAWLELDLRSEEVSTLDALAKQVEKLARTFDELPGLEVEIEVIGLRPAGSISPNHPLIRLARRCLEAQGIHPNLGIGSTDANIPLSRGLPAVCIGLGTGGGAHTVQEYINIRPVHDGLNQLLALVQGAFTALK